MGFVPEGLDVAGDTILKFYGALKRSAGDETGVLVDGADVFTESEGRGRAATWVNVIAGDGYGADKIGQTATVFAAFAGEAKAPVRHLLFF